MVRTPCTGTSSTSIEPTEAGYWAVIGNPNHIYHASGTKLPECLPPEATNSVAENSRGTALGMTCCSLDGSEGIREPCNGIIFQWIF